MSVGTVFVPQMGSSADVEPGGVIEELINRDNRSFRQRVLESVELPHGHGSRPGKGNVRGFGALLRRNVDMADTGQQSGDRCRRRNLTAGERLADSGFVMNRSGPVVPPVGLELFADTHELVDNVWTVSAGGLFRCS